ncbi:MAG: hypothetical protein LBU61_05020 [Coriobacteriales bacterium]|jgi:hypothetical protein|nr:hypothetical protein [Coriobacteriales bacterium]
MKKRIEVDGEPAKLSRKQDMIAKNWVEMSLEDLDEFIEIGDTFSFNYNNKDYIIEGANFDVEAKGRVGCYVIGDESTEHPDSRKAKTPNELKALPFLDGKTILEAFDELKFFD